MWEIKQCAVTGYYILTYGSDARVFFNGNSEMLARKTLEMFLLTDAKPDADEQYVWNSPFKKRAQILEFKKCR